MFKKILLSMLAIFMGGLLVTAPVLAEECTLTSVIGGYACDKNGNKIHKIDDQNPLKSGEYNCSCDDGKGSSIFNVLNLVVDIMSIGIGILGVIGITIVGIQYLTAGGSEEKTRKAKRRMFEIIIGLIVYVLIYAVLKWLLPGVG